MRGNPIRELIPDDLYFKLKAKGFLNERAIRDHYLKKRFHFLRSRYSSREIFSRLQHEFPYLSEDTIRKIIYSKNSGDFNRESGADEVETFRYPHLVLSEP
jgi:hypothetical protein